MRDAARNLTEDVDGKENGWVLSLVVPVMNEEKNIGPFQDVVFDELAKYVLELEILFVDDGSRDANLEELPKASSDDPRVRYMSFSRNFGKETAMTAGITHGVMRLY